MTVFSIVPIGKLAKLTKLGKVLTAGDNVAGVAKVPAATRRAIVASDGTELTGFTWHGIHALSEMAALALG